MAQHGTQIIGFEGMRRLAYEKPSKELLRLDWPKRVSGKVDYVGEKERVVPFPASIPEAKPPVRVGPLLQIETPNVKSGTSQEKLQVLINDFEECLRDCAIKTARVRKRMRFRDRKSYELLDEVDKGFDDAQKSIDELSLLIDAYASKLS